MISRLIAALFLALTLGFVFLAPQGLLTNPTLDEGWQNPVLVAELGPEEDYLTARASLDSLVSARQGETALPGLWYLGLAKEGVERAVPVLVVELESDVADDSAALAQFRHELLLEYPGLIWTPQPAGDGLLVHFPYRGRWSYQFADWKVYKAISKDMRRREWPGPEVLEIHDLAGEEFRYRMMAPGQEGTITLLSGDGC